VARTFTGAFQGLYIAAACGTSFLKPPAVEVPTESATATESACTAA
jgi:hypothetical protein